MQPGPWVQKAEKQRRVQFSQVPAVSPISRGSLQWDLDPHPVQKEGLCPLHWAQAGESLGKNGRSLCDGWALHREGVAHPRCPWDPGTWPRASMKDRRPCRGLPWCEETESPVKVGGPFSSPPSPSAAPGVSQSMGELGASLWVFLGPRPWASWPPVFPARTGPWASSVVGTWFHWGRGGGLHGRSPGAHRSHWAREREFPCWRNSCVLKLTPKCPVHSHLPDLPSLPGPLWGFLCYWVTSRDQMVVLRCDRPLSCWPRCPDHCKWLSIVSYNFPVDSRKFFHFHFHKFVNRLLTCLCRTSVQPQVGFLFTPPVLCVWWKSRHFTFPFILWSPWLITRSVPNLHGGSQWPQTISPASSLLTDVPGFAPTV